MIPTSPGTRLSAIERWWQQLDELDRERARYFASTDQRLSRALFVGLCDAGVLAVDHYYREMIEAAEAPTFPMPGDLRDYIKKRAPGHLDVRAS